MSTNPSNAGSGRQTDAAGQVRIPGPARIDVPPPRETARVAASPVREQEDSIRDRKTLMFDDEELPDLGGTATVKSVVVARSFREYLMSTPAQPLSNATKVLLYVAGAVVTLLFLAALMKGG